MLLTAWTVSPSTTRRAGRRRSGGPPRRNGDRAARRTVFYGIRRDDDAKRDPKRAARGGFLFRDDLVPDVSRPMNAKTLRYLPTGAHPRRALTTEARPALRTRAVGGFPRRMFFFSPAALSTSPMSGKHCVIFPTYVGTHGADETQPARASRRGHKNTHEATAFVKRRSAASGDVRRLTRPVQRAATLGDRRTI